MSDDGIKILCEGRYISPDKYHVADIARRTQVFTEFYKTLKLLLLAGFCLLFMAVPCSGQVPIFRPTEPAQHREWYLVSEAWCLLCPEAKERFLAKGWPEKNILTRDECRAKFGFTVPRVPYEFPEPLPEVDKSAKVVSDTAKRPQVVQGRMVCPNGRCNVQRRGWVFWRR